MKYYKCILISILLIIISLSVVSATEDVTAEASPDYVTDEQISSIDELGSCSEIEKISGGDEANAEDKDLKLSQDNDEIISLEAPTINVNADNVSYGQPAVFEIVLNDDATGNVTVSVDNQVKTAVLEAGKANITISGLAAGEKTATLTYTGDEKYSGDSLTCSFSISKIEAPITVSISGENIKIGQTASIAITTIRGVTGDVLVYVDNNLKKTYTINKYGRVGTLTLSDLEMGNHTINVTYAGDGNYSSFDYSGTVTVSDFENPQWPNEGYDVYNSGSSPYASDLNGAIVWSVDVNGNIAGNIAIDSNGNVYVASTSGIYCYDNMGNVTWKYEPWGADAFGGIAISRDVIIAPRSGDTLYFLNQNGGGKYGSSNIWQASSKFAPIVDAQSNVYISGEYQYGSGIYNLVIVPYSIWATGGSVTTVSLGTDEVTSSPLIINENMVAVNTVAGLKIVDISSKTVIAIINMDSQVKPVVSQGIIYCCDDNSIKAVTVENQVLWKVNVTGGLGSDIAICGDYIYSVNSRGFLYKYDLNDDGKEYMVYNISKEVSSDILTDNDGTVYFTTDDGIFYAINANGNVVLKSNIGVSVKGKYVMDNKGVIYFVTGENKLYALGTSSKADADIKANVSDVHYGENVLINVEANEYAVGNVSVVINGQTYWAELDNGNAIINISNLDAGNYSTVLNYSGDRQFNSTAQNIEFKVMKYVPAMSVAMNESILVNETLIISVTLPEDATGSIVVTTEKGNVTQTASQNVEISISDLIGGKANRISVIYLGNAKYLNSTFEKDVNVEKVSIEVTDNTIVIDSPSNSAVPEVSINLPASAKGNLTVTIGDKVYSQELVNGSATVKISDLPAGTYDAVVTYTGDDKYGPIVKNTTIKVSDNKKQDADKSANKAKKAATKITAKNKKFKAKKKVKKYTITLKAGKKPVKKVKVTLKVKGKTYRATTNAKGKATFKIKKLTKKGKYTAVIKFKGNKAYKASSKKVKITVKK